MIGLCIDVLADNLELPDLRELVEEVNENRSLFINFLINRLDSEVKEREERLLENGYCPECESKLTFSNIYEKHEIWGHNQVCRVGSVAECVACGWKGE
ncbi:MAG TPA: hypothetical protein GX519_03045 [Thermoanaerobacterales bacterium]|nr:hypothetical protein [Thermoanaerobacterales bacterium]